MIPVRGVAQTLNGVIAEHALRSSGVWVTPWLLAASRPAPPGAPDPPRSRSTLGEGSCLGVPPVGLDPVDPVEVGEREDVEELGAGSRA